MEIIKRQQSLDGTIKFLVKLEDGLVIETVALSFRKKFTLCLSTQVGCKFGCSFCFTGKQKFQRNLTGQEIVNQYLVVWNYLKTNDLTIATANIVFMGQGEPLDNIDALNEALLYFIKTDGLKLSLRQMTISTAGYLPGVKRLIELPSVNLAISLHSAIPEKRDEIMPINKKYPITEIINVIKDFPLAKRQYLAFEYLLIRDFNNNYQDAKALYQLIKNLKAIVNIIPFNPYPDSPYLRPTKEEIDQFKKWLVEFKLRTMIRTSRGMDIMAACGQLRYSQDS